MNAACIITTINPPTAAVQAWHEKFGERLIVIGDEKTPTDWRCGNAQYYCTEQQGYGYTQFELSRVMPANHYARKNIGYLQAMRLGSGSIFDTDDDNAPEPCWAETQEDGLADVIVQPGWCNVYSWLQGEYEQRQIWPRGLPLTHIRDPREEIPIPEMIRSSIQQCMANVSPDVDAIHRLVDPGIYLFERKRSIALSKNVWCPFNSQATWWFKDAFPLMYLPIHATFRMTDIWRSFVAQRCLWAMGDSVVFHSPAEVRQDRNPHDLMKDFEAELPGYLYNEKIAAMLEALPLINGKENLADNMKTCYAALVSEKFLPPAELPSLDAWLSDARRLIRK